MPLFGLGLFGICGGYAAPKDPLWIVDSVGEIGIVNLSNGQVTLIGRANMGLTDIAFTSNGDFYGTDGATLYSVSTTTAQLTAIGEYNEANTTINALVGSGTGLLAAASDTDSIYSINASAFSITTLNGSTDGESAGDLAWSPTKDALYESLGTGYLDRITISNGTITSSQVGNMGTATVYGLSTGDDGVMYAVSGTEIYTVNLSTAALTPFMNYSGHGLGSAFGSAFADEAAPELPTPVILGGLLLGLGLVRRRSAA